MSFWDLIEPQSEHYRVMREKLRRQAQAYARNAVGSNKSNARTRIMLAKAYDAGVSSMVEEMRMELVRNRNARYKQYVDPSRIRDRGADLEASLASDPSLVRRSDGPIEGSERVDVVERENGRERIDGDIGGYGDPTMVDRDADDQLDHKHCAGIGKCWSNRSCLDRSVS